MSVPDVAGRDLDRPDRVTPYEGRRYTDTADYLHFVRRVLRGLSQRVGTADLEALRAMTALRDELEGCILDAVSGLRHDSDLPASWEDIGEAMGITRQAAQRRYGKVGGIRRPGGQPAGWR